VKRPLRAAFACGLVAVIAIACSKRPASATLIPTPGARSAAVYAVVNRVEARASAAAKLAPVANGYVLGVGSQLQTGETASARLDFADESFVRLTEKSSLTLQAVNTGARPLKRLQLEIGTLWVSLASGTLEVETPVGSVSVRGSFAIIRYAPGDPANPDDDLLVVDCLEGTCAVQNDTRDIQMGNMERAVVNQQGQLRMVLTGADVEAFLKQNPETRGLVETLTAAPPATDTPSPTGTPTAKPATAATTLTPVSTATPIRLATSATVTPSPTVTPFKPTATLAAAILGRHIVRAGETLFCIARVYGVAPDAIAQVNGLAAPDFLVTTGQTLKIPSVRWTAVIPGPACTPQFNSPFNPLPTTPPATRTPTPTGSLTPAPTATCEPGHFYDPFQKRCRPPDTPAPLITNTPTNPPIPTITNTPTKTNTPLPTNTPTQTDTPLPDTLGPSITNPSANPLTVSGDGSTPCSVTFQVTIGDPSGVASASIVWTTYDSGGASVTTVNTPLALASGDTFLGVWSATFNVPIPAGPGSKLKWDAVQALDTLSNFQGIATAIEVINNGTGACP